jgi:Transcriptional regulator C-terminal region
MRNALMKLFAGPIQGKSSARRSGGVPADFAVRFLASAVLGLICSWLDEGMKYSPEQLASWSRRIFYKGFVAVLLSLEN